MTIAFERPIGASSDVAEIEYVAALHQTCEPELRRDGSIYANDIMHFLSSRYGIRVTTKEVQETIIRGLGGGDNEDECIDLTEVLGILMIPEILKAANDRCNVSQSNVLREKSRDDFKTAWQYKDHLRRLKLAKARQPDPKIIERVLNMILKDSTGDTVPKLLDKELLKNIFAAYGERDLVEDDDLLDEMILAATDGKEGLLLDSHTFARALTHDVQKYDVKTETDVTTHYFDVFRTVYSTKKKKTGFLSLPSLVAGPDAWADEEANGHNSGIHNGEDVRAVEREFTAASIDYAADTYRSKSFVVTLWTTGVVTYFAYLRSITNFGRIDCESRKSQFGCKIANGIIQWTVIMLQLSIFGFIFIVCGSLGNSIYYTGRAWITFGFISIAIFTIIPFIIEVDTPFFNTMKKEDEENRLLYHISIILGCVLMSMQCFHFIRLSIPMKFLQEREKLARFLTPGLAKTESQIKLAAGFKVNRIIRNADEVHQALGSEQEPSKVSATSYGKALLNYTRACDKYEVAGGFFWTWKRLISGSLFTEEGIWLSSRLLAGNFSQIIVCMLILATGTYFLKLEIKAFDEQSDDTSAFSNLEPEEWMIIFPTVIGIFVGLAAAISIVFIYIPSAVATVIQFRTGNIASLKSTHFPRLRTGLEQTTLLFGTIFWGALFTASMMALIVALVLFFVCWQVTRPLALNICASVIGLGITIGFKTVVLSLLRRSYYAAFYRKKPAHANYMSVVLECWNIALTSGYMLVRTGYLIIASAMYIGRIDRPFLTEEAATFGPIHLDMYPQLFRKDLLSHEAHRHPFIERLGVMYMLKLRHGEHFARTSGSCWRLLFVFALMPWMRKYRILNYDDVDESNFKFSSFRQFPPKRMTNGATEEIPDEENVQINKCNELLRKENDMLRHENEALKAQMMQTGNNGYN